MSVRGQETSGKLELDKERGVSSQQGLLVHPIELPEMPETGSGSG